MLAENLKQAAHDDAGPCVSVRHCRAIRSMAAAIKNNDRTALASACAALALLDDHEADVAPLRDPRVRDMFEEQQ